MDDAIPEGTLEYGVVGKALANSVGWVDRCGALALRDHLWSRQRWLADLDLLSCLKKWKGKKKKEPEDKILQASTFLQETFFVCVSIAI